MCPVNEYKTAEMATANWKDSCKACGDGLETVGTGAKTEDMCFGK